MSEPTEAQIEAERRAIIKKTVDAMIAENVVIAHPTVAARLEKDFPGFEYRPKLDNFRAVLDQNIPPQPAPVVGALAAIQPTDTAAPVEAEPEPMDLEQLRAHIHGLEMSRAELRSQLSIAEGARGQARANLATALAAFISKRPAVTPHQLAQNFCAAAAAERQAAKDKGRADIPPAAVHPMSELDRNAAWAKSGGATGHLQRQLRIGSHRGRASAEKGAPVVVSYPQSMRGAYVGPPKVPSER